MIKIHFICTHNTFRSRVAEAYLNSKRLEDVKVSSSGVDATGNYDGAVSWFAQRLLIRQSLIGNEKLKRMIVHTLGVLVFVVLCESNINAVRQAADFYLVFFFGISL